MNYLYQKVAPIWCTESKVTVSTEFVYNAKKMQEVLIWDKPAWPAGRATEDFSDGKVGGENGQKVLSINHIVRR